MYLVPPTQKGRTRPGPTEAQRSRPSRHLRRCTRSPKLLSDLPGSISSRSPYTWQIAVLMTLSELPLHE